VKVAPPGRLLKPWGTIKNPHYANGVLHLASVFIGHIIRQMSLEIQQIEPKAQFIEYFFFHIENIVGIAGSL
jgi:hypothetical protein